MNFWFFLRKNPASGKHIIYARLTYNGKKLKFSTKIEVGLNEWDQANQKIKNRSRQQENDILVALRSQLNALFNEFKLSQADFTVTDVLNKFRARSSPNKNQSLKPKILFETLVADFIKDLKQSEKTYETIRTYESKHKMFSKFLIDKKKKNISIEEIDEQLGLDFQVFLKPHCGSQHNNRTLGFIKRVLKYAVKKKLIEKNTWTEIENLEVKRKIKDHPFISEDQRQVLEHFKFASPKMREVVDFFLFLSYTGMAYADAAEFRFSDHTYVLNGKRWIRKVRRKMQRSGETQELPLFPEAERILNKYGGEKLPELGNCFMNAVLKEVAVITNINVHLTTHVGRKSFGNYWINAKGKSLEVVSMMMGCSVSNIKEHYARVRPERLAKELEYD